MAAVYRLLAAFVVSLVFEFSADVDAYSYIGCFQDAVNYKERALPEDGMYIPRIDIDKCHQYCTAEGFVYFGVEADLCFCGTWNTDYAKYGPLEEARCSTRCRGNQAQMCGGHSALRVFVDNIPGCEDIDITHGQMNRLGLAASFSCNNGYSLHGTKQMNCIYDHLTESYRWDGNPPICTVERSTKTPRRKTTSLRATPTTVRITSTQTTTKYHTTSTLTTLQTRVPDRYTSNQVYTKETTSTKVRKVTATKTPHQVTTQPKEDKETQGNNKEFIRNRSPQAEQEIKSSTNGSKLMIQYSMDMIVICMIGLIVGTL